MIEAIFDGGPADGNALVMTGERPLDVVRFPVPTAPPWSRDYASTGYRIVLYQLDGWIGSWRLALYRYAGTEASPYV